jgi:hypothetical protein
MCDNNGLTLNPKDPIYKLIVDIPDFNSNPVGTVARKALVSKLKGRMPGRHTTAWYDPKSGQTFRQIFFPNYNAAQYEEYVASHTGLSDDWWSDFSVAVLCQSMYWQTSDLRPQLLIDDINTEVNNYNRNVRAAGVGWYSYVLFLNFMKYSGDLTTARNTYVNQICCKDWVTLKMKQYNDGTWANPDWEEFHHWAKLSSLGATDDEIATVINKLRNLGLRIFPDVDVQSWRSYFVWYKPDQLNHTDVDNDARNGETCEVYIPGFGVPGTFMKEENSFEFTANGQPGNKFRSTPHSSCFSATTMVLMPDGSLKDICKIKVGDKVQTPSGPRKVQLISTPYANGRKLYGVNKTSGFHFTITHPFINGQRKSDNNPLILAVSPLNLIRNIPMIGYEGVGKLAKGAYLLSFESGTCQPRLVESVDEIPSDESDQLLYDLILEPDMSGHFQYIVGAKDNLFVVASELPTYKNAKPAELMACSAILNAIDAASAPLNTLLASCSQQLYLQKIDSIACMLSSCLLSYEHRSGGASIVSQLNSTDLSEFLRLLVSKFEMFTLSDGEYCLATGEAFAYLSARLGHQLASAILLGYRIIQSRSDPDVLALSLLDMQTTAPVALNSLSNPTITVQLDDLPPEQYAVAENGVHFGVRIFKISYFQVCDVRKQREHRLKVVIQMNNGEVLQASTYINLPLQLYRHYRLPIFSDQDEKGILSLDVYYLSTTDMNEEKKSISGWNEQKMLNYTNCLTKTAGELLQKLCEQK